MLQAYFDESEHQESGLFCIAGYGMMSHQVRRFNREWRDLFGSLSLHMKHFVHRRGDFDGMKDDETNRLLKGAIEIINRRVAFGVAVFCHLDNINESLNDRIAWFRGLENPYSISHHACMVGVGQWSREHDAGHVAYVFEDGYRNPGAVTQMLAEIKKSPQAVEHLALGSHTFAGRQEFLPLQAADLLAWEWVKAHREPERPLRASLEELITCRRIRYLIYYLGKSNTSRFLDYTERIAVDTQVENFERAQERKRRRELSP